MKQIIKQIFAIGMMFFMFVIGGLLCGYGLTPITEALHLEPYSMAMNIFATIIVFGCVGLLIITIRLLTTAFDMEEKVAIKA